MKLVKWLLALFTPKPTISYYTIDGKVLAPYPNMTDDDLKSFEKDLDIPSSFKS